MSFAVVSKLGKMAGGFLRSGNLQDAKCGLRSSATRVSSRAALEDYKKGP